MPDDKTHRSEKYFHGDDSETRSSAIETVRSLTDAAQAEVMRLIEPTSEVSLRLRSHYLHRRDFEESLLTLRHVGRRFENPNYMRRYFFEHALVRYAGCFLRSGRRKLVAEEFYSGYDLELHEHMKILRDKHVAHDDELLLQAKVTVSQKTVDTITDISGYIIEAEYDLEWFAPSLTSILRIAIIKITESISRLTSELRAEFESMTVEQCSALPSAKPFDTSGVWPMKAAVGRGDPNA